MAANDKTVFDPVATRYEGDKTVMDSPQTVLDGGTTLAEAALSDAAAQDETAVPAENAAIIKGETILDTYTVESDAIEGGMGSVWRVHHKGWNVDLAMKRPQPQCFSTEKSKADFIHECEAWINLGLHPNIVSCYYVREISGTPTIFSEWMDGGSLEGAIAKGTLYAGSEAEQQERILDIAVQFARGLYYAHEAGLIHQDVKPDNLLLTKDGEAKVADFGLAKARAVLTVLDGAPTMNDSPADSGKTIASPSGGYTPAYCSMEQMDGKELTRRTDIYSWAVSVMEMYLGERPWSNPNYPTGPLAGLNCRSYFEDARVPVPNALKELLEQCMASEPENRPHDFAEVEAKLHEIYKAETGSDYPRPTPKAAADTADSLNNRALSMLDLGKYSEAEKLWEMAIGMDAKHVESVYNRSLYLWRAGVIDDHKAVQDLIECSEGGAHVDLIAQLELERGNGEAATELLGGALSPLNRAAASLPPLNLTTAPINGEGIGLYELHLGTDGDTLFGPYYAGVLRFSASTGKALPGIYIKPERGFDHLAPGNGRGASAICLYTADKPPKFSLRLFDANTTELGRVISLEEHIPFCFSPDGSEIYTLRKTRSNYMDVLDAATGRVLRTLEGYRMEKLFLSGDGTMLAVCSADASDITYSNYTDTLVLYDARTLKRLHTLTGHTQEADGAVFSPDGRRLYSCSPDNSIRVWDTASGECLAVWGTISKRRIEMNIALSPDGRFLAACIGREYIRLLDAQSGHCLRTIPCDGYGPMRFVGDRLAAYHTEGYSSHSFVTLRLPCFGFRAPWALSRVKDVKTSLDIEATFEAALEGVREEYSSGRYAVAMEKLEAARRVEGMENDPRARELNRAIGAHGTREGLRSVAPYRKLEWEKNYFSADALFFSADGRLLLCKSSFHALLYDVRTGERLRVFEAQGNLGALSTAAMDPTGRYVYLVDGHLYSVADGSDLGLCPGRENRVRVCNFSGDGRLLATGDSHGLLLVHDTASRKLLTGFQFGHDVDSLRFLPDGDTILVSAEYNRFQLVSVSQKKILRNFSIGTFWSGYEALELSPDGQYAIVKADSACRMFEVESEKLLYGDGSQPKLYPMCFIGHGTQVLFSIDSTTVAIAATPASKPDFVLTDYYNSVMCLAVSPNGQYVAVASHNASVFLYELDWRYSLGQDAPDSVFSDLADLMRHIDDIGEMVKRQSSGK